MNANLSFLVNPNKVYVIGAAGFWLKHWPTSDEDRERRIFEAFDKKFGKRIAREKRLIKRRISLVH